MSDINGLNAIPPTPGASGRQSSASAASKYLLSKESIMNIKPSEQEIEERDVTGSEVEERVDVGDSKFEETSEPSTTHPSTNEPGEASSSTGALPLPSVVTPLEHPEAALLRLLHPEIVLIPPPTSESRHRHQTDITSSHASHSGPECKERLLFAEEALELPLDTFLTFNFSRHHRHWKKGNRSPEQVPYVRDKILKTLEDWCRHHAIDPRWVYALENPPEGGHGPHLHLLMHLPEDRWSDLSAALATCLRKSMGWLQKDLEDLKAKIYAHKGGIGSCDSVWLPFLISASKDSPGGPLTPQESLTRLRYLCKSVDPHALVEIGGKVQTLEDHAGPAFDPYITLQNCGDPRTKKRLGTSQNLGIQARSARGWVEETDFGWMSRKVQRDELIANVMSLLKGFEQGKLPPPQENRTPPIEPFDAW